MHHIACRVPVCNDNSAVFIKLFPLGAEGSKPVDGIEQGCCIRIHIHRIFTEISAKVHFHKSGRFTFVIRKGNMHDILPETYQILLQKF